MVKFYKKITCLLISMLISSNIVFAGMLDGKKIVLDAGHGGKDPGAVYGGFKEKDINMDIIIKTFNILKKFGAEIILTRNDDEYVSLQDRVKKANESEADLFISVHNNVSAYEKDGQVIINSAVNGTEVYYSSSRPNIKIQKYVDYNGSRYEYVKEEKINGVDYVYILVDKNLMKIPKNQVKIVDNKTYQAQQSVDLAQMVLDGITSLGFNNRGVRDSNYYVTKYTNMPSILIEAGFMTNSNDLERITNEEIQEKIAYKISDAVYKYFETDEKNKRKSFGHIRDLEFIISNRYALAGQAIELKLDGVKNYDDYLYKLEIKKDNKEVYSKGYGTEYSSKFTPQDDGIYDVTFYLKQKQSTKEYDDKISGNFIVFKSPKIKDVIMSVQRMDVNKPIIFNVVKEFGTIEGVDYSFDVYLNDKKIESSTSKSGVFSFTPKSEGEYKLVVYLRDKLSNQKFDDMFETKFVVGNYKDISRGGNPPSENSDNKEQNEQKEKTNQQESVENVMQIKYTRPLSLGISGQDVNELQEALKRLGYLKIDKTTTYFGNMTKDAVMAFQRANKLTVDGIAGPMTISKINEELNKQVKNETEKQIKTEDIKNTTVSDNKATTKTEENVMQIKYTRPLSLGISGQDVNELQEALKRLGYLKIDKTTTYYGYMTRDAVMEFQRANKLTVDGVAGPNTISKINEELNKQVKKETEKQIKTEDTKNTTVSDNKSTTKMEENIMQIKYTRPLRLGISGQDVNELQEALKRLGYLKIDRTTTYYGYMTRDAVMEFQRANKLTVDGVAGPSTIKVINQKLK